MQVVDDSVLSVRYQFRGTSTVCMRGGCGIEVDREMGVEALEVLTELCGNLANHSPRVGVWA